MTRQVLCNDNIAQIFKSLIKQLKGDEQIQQATSTTDCFDDISKILPEEINTWTQIPKDVVIARLERKTIRNIKKIRHFIR